MVALCGAASLAVLAIDFATPATYWAPVAYPLLVILLNERGGGSGDGAGFLWFASLLTIGGVAHRQEEWMPLIIDRGLVLAVIGALAITARRQRALQTELRSLAITDPLTGLANRRKYLADAEAERQRAFRYRRKFAVMMLDIDHFKQVNDRFGHPAGDQVLRTLAKVCVATLRPVDRFARFGGEEFIAALPETSYNEALAAAERLRKAASEIVVRVDDHEIRFTVSIGVSEWLPTEASIQSAIERADRALYRAKNGGRDRVCAEMPDGGVSL